jgi:putative membrane protein
MHDSGQSWSVVTTLALVLLAAVYSRGWSRPGNDGQDGVQRWRGAAFIIGMVLLFAVVASPLASLDHHGLTGHMVQHLVLMTLAAPLVLVGEPAITLWHGLPVSFRAVAPGPLLRCAQFRGCARILASPVSCWLAGTVCVIVWHVPGALDRGLESAWWHDCEQVSFFAAGLLFWWPVLQPWPDIRRWPRWSIPLYLFFATIPCDVLSAFLTFCGHVVYPIYVSGPHPVNSSALRDQESAGALMWVWVTFAYLIPSVVITIQCLSPRRQSVRSGRVSTPVAPDEAISLENASTLEYVCHRERPR